MAEKTFLCETTITTEHFKNLIDKNKITREKFAEILGCDTSLVTKYYNGQREIPVKNIVKIAKYFNVTTDYLLGLDVRRTNGSTRQSEVEETLVEIVKSKEYGESVEAAKVLIELWKLM